MQQRGTMWRKLLGLLMVLTLVVSTLSPFKISATEIEGTDLDKEISNIVSIESLELSDETVSLTEGKSKTITAKITPDNTIETVTWSSSDDNIATVKDGEITAVAVGLATITATVGTISKTIEVTVTANKKSLPGKFTASNYFKDLVIVANGKEVPFKYNENLNKYEIEVPPSTTTVEVFPTIQQSDKGDEYTRIASSTAIEGGHQVKLTATASSMFENTTKSFNLTVRSTSTGSSDLESYSFVISRPAEPMTVDNSSDLLDLKFALHTPANSTIPNKVYIENEGELVATSMSEATLQENSTFYVLASDKAKASTIGQITVTPTARYKSLGATFSYKVNGEIVNEKVTTALSKYAHSNYEYEPGKFGTKIEVTVHPSVNAPQGSKENTYTIIVPKTMATATNITALTIASPNNHQFLAAIGEGVLLQKGTTTKGFKNSVFEYETIVNYNIDHLAMKTTFDGPGTTLKFNVNGDEIVSKEIASYTVLPLKVGNNVITVRAIPESGDETNINTYTFNIKRKANYNIASIESAEMRIAGQLRPTLTTLAGIVEEGTKTYTMTLKAEDPTKNITIEQSGKVIAEGKDSLTATLDASIIEVSGRNNISQNPVKITIGDEEDQIVYTLDSWVRNPNAPNRVYAIYPAPGQFVNEHAQTVTGALGSFGWGDGWDTSLYATSANLTSEASGTPGVSLGGFGGFITYQFDNPVKNDPEHPYGSDFIVNGNGFNGNEEPGGVMVAQDKDKDSKPDKDANGEEIWYELAGSEHYENTTIWDYSITYINTVNNFFPNFGKNVPWKDSRGRSGEIIHNGYHAQLYYPITENYHFEGNAANSMMSDKQITFKGTNIQTLKTLYGYADVSPNNKGVSIATNPYEHANAGGGFFDIDWAVDKNGKPVQLDEISFVKVYTNQQTDGGAVGEKSPEILGVLRINDENKASGKTEVPVVKINDQQITLSEDAAFIPVTVDSLDAPLKVAVESTANNVYINNVKAATHDYEKAPDKGIIRVLVQNGDKTPAIYTFKITKQTSDTADIQLSKTNVTLKEGQTDTVTATITPENDEVDKTITWTSANEEVAIVENGVITAVKAGTTTITAKAGSLTKNIAVTVEKEEIDITDIQLSKTNITLKEGQTDTVTATITPKNVEVDKTITWTSANEEVATVENGVITAVKAGTTTITAKAGQIIKDISVKVEKKHTTDDNTGGGTVPQPNAKGYVYVSFEDYGQRPAGELVDYPTPFGMIIKREAVPFYTGDTIADVTLRLLDSHKISYEHWGTTKNGFYLSSLLNLPTSLGVIPSFGEFNGGPLSGWMISWNNWFINQGASEFLVEDGDIIKWQYTGNLGADLNVDWNVKSAKISGLNIQPSSATLSPAFSRDVKNYTITVPKGTKTIKLEALQDNYWANVTYKVGSQSYKVLSNIPVSHGTVINITSEFREYFNDATPHDTDKITITIVEEGQTIPDGSTKPDTNGEANPEEPEHSSSILMESTGDKQSATITVDKEVKLTTVTSKEGIQIQIPSAALQQEAVTVALQVAKDSIVLEFEANNKQIKLKKYVDVTIPTNVLSPANGAVLLKRLEDGSLVAVPYTIKNNQFVFKTTTSSEYLLSTETKIFKDTTKDRHKQYIEELAKRHIVHGKSNETFDPATGMTRGEFSAILVRALNTEAEKTSTFKDLQNHRFAQEIQALVEMGVLKGNGDKMMPNNTVTRIQAALMIHRLLTHLEVEVPNVSVEKVSFTDKGKISKNSLESVALMQELGIFTGHTDGSFDPDGKLTRSQMAKVIYKALSYAEMM